MKLCEPCKENSGLNRKATWRLPQSCDGGKTVTYMAVCDSHACGWWEGADWNGQHLEQKLVETP